jgi:hypothetical protein
MPFASVKALRMHEVQRPLEEFRMCETVILSVLGLYKETLYYLRSRDSNTAHLLLVVARISSPKATAQLSMVHVQDFSLRIQKHGRRTKL